MSIIRMNLAAQEGQAVEEAVRSGSPRPSTTIRWDGTAPRPLRAPASREGGGPARCPPPAQGRRPAPPPSSSGRCEAGAATGHLEGPGRPPESAERRRQGHEGVATARRTSGGPGRRDDGASGSTAKKWTAGHSTGASAPCELHTMRTPSTRVFLQLGGGGGGVEIVTPGPTGPEGDGVCLCSLAPTEPPVGPPTADGGHHPLVTSRPTNAPFTIQSSPTQYQGGHRIQRAGGDSVRGVDRRR